MVKRYHIVATLISSAIVMLLTVVAAQSAGRKPPEIIDMNAALIITYADMRKVPNEFNAGRTQEGFVVTLGVENKTSREITGFTVILTFYDHYGHKIDSLTYNTGKASVPAGIAFPTWQAHFDPKDPAVEKIWKAHGESTEKLGFGYDVKNIIFKGDETKPK